jgi:hypothetical protein
MLVESQSFGEGVHMTLVGIVSDSRLLRLTGNYDERRGHSPESKQELKEKNFRN